MSVSARRSRRRFLFGLFIFASVLLVAGAAVLGWLWGELARYEANTPESSVRRYLDQVRRGEWDALYESSGFQPTPAADREDYIAYLQRTYEELPEEYVLVRVSGAGEQTYALTAAEREIARLELTQAQAGSPYRWEVRTQVTPIPPVEVSAPAFVTVLADQLVLDETYQQNLYPAEGYGELPEEIQAPQMVTYRMEGFLAPPQLTAQGPDGTVCSVSALEEKEGLLTASVTVAPGKEQEEEYWILAEEAAKTYAAFITSDAERDQLNAYLLPDTNFYQAIQEFYNGWYIEHTGYRYENLIREQMTLWGEDAFSAVLSFDYLIYRGYKEYRYPSSYQLDFVRTAQGWKLVQLITR